jgi:hypothetical protein
MRAAATLVLLLPIPLLVAGCSGPAAEQATSGAALPDEEGPGPFLVLDATFVGGGQFHGHHCGRASVRDGTVRLESDDRAKLGEGPSVVVLPKLEGAWATIGNGGFAQRLPADVEDQAAGAEEPLVRIEWLDEARVRIDGDVQGLPHEWSVERDGYRVDLKLQRGPSVVEWYHVPMCI